MEDGRRSPSGSVHCRLPAHVQAVTREYAPFIAGREDAIGAAGVPPGLVHSGEWWPA